MIDYLKVEILEETKLVVPIILKLLLSEYYRHALELSKFCGGLISEKTIF